VLSVDGKTDLAQAQRELGPRIALQGNVDPSILLGPVEQIQRATVNAVEKTGGIGHILNLGHGILPNTPVESARAFVSAGKSAPVAARPASAGRIGSPD
jgi:uroporphyrinogen decarboxylase